MHVYVPWRVVDGMLDVQDNLNHSQPLFSGNMLPTSNLSFLQVTYGKIQFA